MVGSGGSRVVSQGTASFSRSREWNRSMDPVVVIFVIAIAIAIAIVWRIERGDRS